jgi:predicted O-methyltransferase YrrM
MNEPELSNWLKFLGPLAGKPNIVGLEIGVFRGDSAEWSLKNIFTNPESYYYCVDPFTAEHQREFGMDCDYLEIKTRARLAPYRQAIVVTERSQTFLKTLTARLDFVYVDGSHTAPDVLCDSVLAFELLKVGGVLIWDDYAWDVVPDELDRPKTAIDAFLKVYARHLRVEFVGWQVIVTKTAI